jgi:transposase
VKQTEYEYLWVVGAVCAETGQAEAILSPHLNTEVMNAFLREFSCALAPDVHAVLIWDGAGFHRSGRLQVPANVSLVELPPYSPQLNPIENLWHYLRSHFWSNRWYENYDALMNAAIDAWRKAALVPEIIQSVCRAKYLEPYQHPSAVIP